MSAPLVMFLVFIAITLAITYWASRRSAGASAYFAAGRQIKSWQNGVAVAGDYMSAASFLGIAGIIAFQGYDGFMFSVGWLVAYLTVLLVIAEPLRNAGKSGACLKTRAGLATWMWIKTSCWLSAIIRNEAKRKSSKRR